MTPKFASIFFFSSRRRHTRLVSDWSKTCALPIFQGTLPAGSPDFSNPTALFNNIFWDNDAMTLSQFGPGATLVDAGFIDFEVDGTGNNADTFTQIGRASCRGGEYSAQRATCHARR